MGNNAPLENGQSIQAVFPDDYGSINFGALACSINNLSVPCALLDSTESAKNQTIILQVNQTVSDLGLTVIIDGVTNPFSTKPTGYFHAIIFDSSGTLIE